MFVRVLNALVRQISKWKKNLKVKAHYDLLLTSVFKVSGYGILISFLLCTDLYFVRGALCKQDAVKSNGKFPPKENFSWKSE